MKARVSLVVLGRRWGAILLSSVNCIGFVANLDIGGLQGNKLAGEGSSASGDAVASVLAVEALRKSARPTVGVVSPRKRVREEDNTAQAEGNQGITLDEID
ncbi:uncharacterized protein [Malus domestica]|uniref:uncharacterized protein n=1 Tax=Malus domestica TaxID=3750 RepID=UPI003976CEBB